MDIPIVLSAFGTASKAFETYSFIDDILKQRFPDNEVVWAYTSRTVKDKLKGNIEIKHPFTVLEELFQKGYKLAVVQSMHLACGHEFHKLVKEANESRLNTSIGLPVLTSYDDYQKVIDALSLEKYLHKDKAVVLVGHGTNHPSWTSYFALESMIKQKYDSGVYVGVLEKGPPKEILVEKIAQSGVKNVILLPLMLVAGIHVEKDLKGDDKDSWTTAFNEKNISVNVEEKAVGYNEQMIEIFINHIQDALNAIPDNSL